ncbi:MAG TPA: hypothetical protein VJK02_03945 [Anaerolineales bacterium]|nr:hypothetical protein [Anaerolineales bacterium]
MKTQTVNQLVDRLVRVEPLAAESFAALLGVSLQLAEQSPFWKSYTFELPKGPFAAGELRVNAAGDGALLILEPRDPPGLGQADIDRQALGPRLGMRPDPRIPPEGIETEYFQKGGVQVATQWTHTSRRLRSLVLKWEPAAVAAS